jgi:hypothetical protein
MGDQVYIEKSGGWGDQPFAISRVPFSENSEKWKILVKSVFNWD